MNEIQKKFGITEEELNALDAIEDVIDAELIIERVNHGALDEKNLFTNWIKLGFCDIHKKTIQKFILDLDLEYKFPNKKKDPST